MPQAIPYYSPQSRHIILVNYCPLLAPAHAPSFPNRLQIVAHNNLACYFRKLGQPALALEHLQRTARLEIAVDEAVEAGLHECLGGSGQESGKDTAAEGHLGGGGGRLGGVVNPTAATLLNLAACSSSLGKHLQALSYATQAVQAAAVELQVRQMMMGCRIRRVRRV